MADSISFYSKSTFVAFLNSHREEIFDAVEVKLLLGGVGSFSVDDLFVSFLKRVENLESFSPVVWPVYGWVDLIATDISCVGSHGRMW